LGGGVGLYLQDLLNLKYTVRPDLSASTKTSFESLFIQLTNKKIKNTIIGVIYRPPNTDLENFTNDMEKLLNIVLKERRPCYLLGDFNIDLLKHDKHSPTQHFIDTLSSAGFYPLINKPARITTNTVTLIDNIFTNIHNTDTKTGIWTVDISDHLPVFAISPSNSEKCKSKKIISKQDFSQENINKFKRELRVYDWSFLNEFSDVEVMYNAFLNKFQSLYAQIFPIKSKIVSIAVNHRPWITPAIKKSIKKKNTLYRTYLKRRSTESLNLYKSYRNKLTTILRKAEKDFYLNKLQSVKDNLAKTWKLLNSIISRTTKKESVPEIICDGNTVTDTKIIANKFNLFLQILVLT
jgi:hypothetical protein